MIRPSEGQSSGVLSILQDSVFPSAVALRSLFHFGDGRDCVEDELEDLWFRLDIRQLFYAPKITFRTLHSSQANKNYGALNPPPSAILLVLGPPVLFALIPQRHLRIFFWHCRSTQTFWNNFSQWTSEELDLTNLNITPFSPALCLGLIDNISNLLLHHFLLIARHYIYSCKLRNTIPMVQVYTQLVIRSMEIEKQIAFDNNNLASFRKKWATFKQCPSEYNLTNTVN